ncbi:MAG: hypothetical protein IIZ78_20780 [Clostridiales bacterium]|nr:hypothetical protein [Clostridiales bacterium]
MDINNYYVPVEVPSLESSTTYAADMQVLVDTINENFRRLGSAVWLKGDRGASVERNDELLFDADENTTDLGRAVFATIYKDYGIEDMQDSNLNTYSSIRNFVSLYENGNIGDVCSFDSIKLRQEYPDDFNDFISVLGIYEPVENIEYTLIDGSFCGPWFFTDARIDKDVLDNMTDAQLQRFTDMSCALYGVYDEAWEVTHYNIMPTLYWNPDSNLFCWKINGRLTNVNAQGLEGDKGDNAQTYVLLGDEIDYENSEDVLMVRLTNVYDADSEDFVSINIYPDRDKLEGCLGAVWFKRQYAPEGPYIATFTLGIITSGANDNYYIKYNTSNSNDINFDFAQIMALLGLKSQLMQITARQHEPQTEENNVLRGLFIPIEKRVVNSEDVESIIRTDRYHEMWSSLNETAISDSTALGMDADLNIGVVENINSPAFNTENPPEANINVYYKNFKTDTSKTRIEAGDVTTGSADAGEIDLCAENDVDIIAGNMVDIDTPKVEMGNDDNKSNAVVHGKLNITGKSDETKSTTLATTFGVIVRPILMECDKTYISSSPSHYDVSSVITFEYIFGYFDNRDVFINTSYEVGGAMPDWGTIKTNKWGLRVYNAQRLLDDYWASPSNIEPIEKEIQIDKGALYDGTLKIKYTSQNRVIPTGASGPDHLYFPKITITYVYNGVTYSVENDFIGYFVPDNASNPTYKELPLLGIRYYRNALNYMSPIVSGTSIQGNTALLQYFYNVNNNSFLVRNITSKKIGDFASYHIYDNNINEYKIDYDYRYGVSYYSDNHSYGSHNHTYDNDHTGSAIITPSSIGIYPNESILKDNKIYITKYDGTVMGIRNNLYIWLYPNQVESLTSFDRNRETYAAGCKIFPKGMVGYLDTDYAVDNGEGNVGGKIYNGGMICSLYHLNSGGHDNIVGVTFNFGGREKITAFTIPDNNDNNGNNEEHSSDIEVEGSEYNG